MSNFETRLKSGEVLVIDGAIATELAERGAPIGEDATGFNAIANIESPDVVKAMHRDYIAAGVTALSTNTFGCGPAELESVGLGDRFEEINRAAVKLAIEAREEANAPDVAIVGVISCVSRSGSLLGSYDDFARVLADAGVDVIAVEMIGTLADGTEAISAVKKTGVPVWVGISAQRAADGGLETLTHDEHFDDFNPPEDVREDVAAFVSLGVDAITVMHTEMEYIEETLVILREEFDGPIGAYPHRGTWEGTWVNDPIDPKDFAAAAVRWVDAGAQIVGGCCGIGPAHIAAVSEALRDRAGANA